MQLPDSHLTHLNDSDDLSVSLWGGVSSAIEVSNPTLAAPGQPRPSAPAVLVAKDAGLMARPTLTVQETADLLGISRWLVQQAVRRGELPVVRIGRRILIPRVRLQALLAGASPTKV